MSAGMGWQRPPPSFTDGARDADPGRAALERRIAALEKDRSDLQADVEALCKQQSGTSATIDVMARMQARRAAGLEQELASCRQSLAALSREHGKLQAELAQAYAAKSDSHKLLQAEVEKVKKMEKDVQFYQSQTASALARRDEAMQEVDVLRTSHTNFLKEREMFLARVDELEAESRQGEEHHEAELSKHLAISVEDVNYMQKVVEAAWDNAMIVMENGSKDLTSGQKAALMVLDEKFLLSLGQAARQDSMLAETQVAVAEAQVAKADAEAARAIRDLVQAELIQERKTRVELDGKASKAHQALLDVRKEMAKACKNLRNLQAELKEEVRSGVREERSESQRQLVTFLVFLQRVAEEERRARDDFDSQLEEQREAFVRMKENLTDKLTEAQKHVEKERISRGIAGDATAFTEEWEAFAQATQEKVAALLLLSQQEERHNLEANTIAALETQTRDLRQQLSQVTGEKVQALMEVAQLKHEMDKVMDYKREADSKRSASDTSASGGMLPASWSVSPSGDDLGAQFKGPPSSTYSAPRMFKGWFQGTARSSPEEPPQQSSPFK
eukprot:SM000034S12656  [mRNA]  locus=s34:30884:35161:+ [translate_table: standard]